MSDATKTYKILKVLNNNVILAYDAAIQQEMVLVGKGVGFGCKADELVEIDLNKLDKSFVTYDQELKNKYLQVIKELNGEVLGIGEEIIAMAEIELGALNPHIHIALTDHIGFALDRLQEGLEFTNPFLDEIKILYADEFRLAIKAAELIRARLRVELPETELGFIALHIHSARQNKKISETVKSTFLLKQLVGIVEREFKRKIDPQDVSYTRLIYHLRFLFNRMEKNKKVKNPLFDAIRNEFRDSYLLAQKLAKQIEARLNISVNEDELGYITLHLQRLKENIL